MRIWKLWLVVLLLIAGGGGFLLWRQRQPGVSVTLDPALVALGHPARTLMVVLRAPAAPLGTVEVRVIQEGVARTVLSEDLRGAGARETRRPLALDVAALKLQEGPADLEVYARDTLWRPRPALGPQLVQRFAVDLTPPPLELRSATGYIKHAGAGVVVYRTEGAARSGVRVGAAWFPGATGLAQDPALHVALFTVPYDGPATAPSVVAEDQAGNQRVIGVPVTFLPARFPKDVIRLSEPFFRKKMPELAPQTPGNATAEQLRDAFLRVNRDGRKAAEARIREIAQATRSPKPLWSGAFRQQPNSKVFANFPEERTYQVDGQTVDTQWHLGIDLASNKQSPVEASNAGRVVFTGANGIYGNMIVLDHGLGLTSLYAHLSEIGVKVGQDVKQGESLGRSGETGLAGGDHLHFAMLVNGVYTSPIEWWDEHWLRDRVAKPLAEAGIAAAGVTDGTLTPAPAAATPAKRAAARKKRP